MLHSWHCCLKWRDTLDNTRPHCHSQTGTAQQCRPLTAMSTCETAQLSIHCQDLAACCRLSCRAPKRRSSFGPKPAAPPVPLLRWRLRPPGPLDSLSQPISQLSSSSAMSSRSTKLRRFTDRDDLRCRIGGQRRPTPQGQQHQHDSSTTSNNSSSSGGSPCQWVAGKQCRCPIIRDVQHPALDDCQSAVCSCASTSTTGQHLCLDRWCLLACCWQSAHDQQAHLGQIVIQLGGLQAEQSATPSIPRSQSNIKLPRDHTADVALQLPSVKMYF